MDEGMEADPANQRDEGLILDEVDPDRKPKARLGDQHYLMLHALQNSGSMSLEQIARTTRLSARRVKDQMVADIGNGFVKTEAGQFSITPKGSDLLARFQELRRSKGMPLPSVEGLHGEDDQDEADLATQTEKGDEG